MRVIGIGIAAPVPDIASHVVETVSVGRKGFDRCETGKAVLGGVAIWERSCKRVGLKLSAWFERFSPDITRVGCGAAPCGIFPFRLGGQTLARPLRVRGRVIPAHLDHRKLVLAHDIALRTL